ncbi:hydrolase [Brachionus plicatilis]|uniref:Hydrolase n=1 Tax=Brachionus plicatilis TaxID=10195 RepID=A0A3M7RGG8_BRAPC|nr:hydrolase [Brachionus plicatilis]
MSKIEKSMRIYVFFSIIDLTVGSLGMLLYGIFTATYGPVWVRNQYIGLWLLTILFFYSIQSLYLELRTWSTKFGYFLDVVYFSISVILTLILAIFYCIPPRIDGLIWAFYIFAVNLTNVAILFLKRHHLNNLARPESKDFQYVIMQIVKVLNFLLRVIFLVVICFLINGASQEAIGKSRYPSRGKFVDLKISDSDSKTVKFHFLCDGPSSNKPLFLFEGSASHGLADYLSIQRLLKQNSRRSCIWDKPGLGYSDYLLTDIKSHYQLYDNLINSLDESGPYHFVGWGGGGSLIYEYAFNHPEKFESMIFIDAAPNDVEIQIRKKIKNWSDAQAEDYKNSLYSERKATFGAINGLGVPFGLMAPFSPNYEPFFPELSDEVKWYFLTEKTWITQEYFLKSALTGKDVFSTYKINQSIPINVITTVKSDDQIREKCRKNGYSVDSEKCKYDLDFNRELIVIRKSLKDLSSNGKLFECSDDECDLGFYVGKGANYTVDKLLQI